MKYILFTIIAISAMLQSSAQITISSADMPVSGDTLRYSFASPTATTISPGDSGTSMSWNYTLAPIRQAIDTYKSAFSVNPLYVITIGTSAYGYKVADSLPISFPGLPSIEQVYTFFETKTGPSRFQAQAFAANIAGIPTPINYSQPDVWYFFPLAYGNNDSANYKLNITLPGFGGLKQVGYRKSRVDGWGTITTPYYTTPVACIRVRSEIHEIDSVQFSTFPAIGFPRNSVEYKWLVSGGHYPALWVTSTLGPGGTETVNTIRYRDNAMPVTDTASDVPVVTNSIIEINAVPNPAANGMLTLQVPADWHNCYVELFDLNSKPVATFGTCDINISSLPAGIYIGRVTSGSNVGYVHIVR